MIVTLRGILLLLVTAPLLALANWFPGLRLLALVYGLLTLAALALDWWLAGDRQRFQLSRRHDTRLSLGADNAIHLELHNRRIRPVTFRLRDEPPEAFRIEERLFAGHVDGRETWRHSYHVRPLRRGDYHFGDLHLRWRGPLGLVFRQATFPAAGPVKVYPNLLDVRRYELLLRRNRLTELGLRNTRRFGEGTEFERLREYLPDDEYRRINWKATARRHRPVTTEYQTERSQTIMAAVDIGRMMQSPVNQIAKLDYVINAVLLLGYVATGMGDKVGVLTFADTVAQYLSPRQGRGQFYRMLEMLYAVEPQPVEPSFRRAFSYLGVKQRKRALIILFTDLSGGVAVEELVEYVGRLARRSLPLVVTISDPDVVAAARQRPSDSASAFQRVAARRLLDDRQVALQTLAHRGVLTLDVPANQLSLAVINRYLELKGRGRL